MFHYAVINFKGEGIPVNKEEAVKYFKMSVDEGKSESVNYYTHFLIGNDNKTNTDVVVDYIKSEIDKGNSDAMLMYAVLLNEGNGIPQNIEEAIKYFEMALENGNVIAHKYLSEYMDEQK